MSDKLRSRLDSGNAGTAGPDSRFDLAGTSFTDTNGNTFYYGDDGVPKYFGLIINGIPPRPVSGPNARATPAAGLVEPGPRYAASGDALGGSGAGVLNSASAEADYPPSYVPGGADYRIAAKKAFNDYSDAETRGDSQALAAARRELAANPPDFMKPDTVPQMQGYDPEAEALRARRFQDDLLGAVSLPAAWAGGAATMLHKDDETRGRWMEGAAELGAELSPFLAEERGLMGNPAARDSLTPVGVPGNIGDKGAAMEGAATLHAYRRGATAVFDGKYGGDNGFDGAYVLRDENGFPQLHIDSVKAVNGRVPVYGRGSMTELGTNKVQTRENAESALRKNIEATPPSETFTKDDKEAVLEQLDRGDVVVNLVGQPGTQFHQGHIDFINNETPYRFGEIHTLDPFSPSQEPLFNGAAYGLTPLYFPGSDSSAEQR